MDKPHVLDILAKKQGCFVSDLWLNPINRRAALADLLLLDDSAFLLKEWKEAVYLKEHHRILFTNLLTSGKLTEHLMEIEEAAQNRMEQIVKGMAAQDGVTEELKARDQMEWVHRMNAIRDSAEEIIFRELIYN